MVLDWILVWTKWHQRHFGDNWGDLEYGLILDNIRKLILLGVIF